MVRIFHCPMFDFTKIICPLLVPVSFKLKLSFISLLDQFENYLKMIIKLGYVTFFVSVYPLAAIIATMSNQAEISIKSGLVANYRLP